MKHFHRRRAIRSLALLIAAVTAAAGILTIVPASPAEAAAANTAGGNATVYAIPSGDGVYPSTDFGVTVDGTSTGLYSDTNGWGNTVSFGYFDLINSVVIKVTVPSTFGGAANARIAPASLGITPTVSGNTLTFTMPSAKNVTIFQAGQYKGKVLHLFGNKPDTSPPSATDANVVYFGPGYHDLRQTNAGEIALTSGQTLYIAPGAVVVGAFLIKDATNVTIRGGGVLAMPYASTKTNVPITIDNSSYVDISGITVNRKNNNWSGLAFDSDHVTIRDYHVVSPTYASTDGFNLGNTHDVLIDNVFMHTADDSVAIKGIAGSNGYNPAADPSGGFANYNITVQNSTFWSDTGDVICLGAETQAASYHDITVKNIDIINSWDDRSNPGVFANRAALDMTALNGTEFYNILFDTIRVEQTERLINFSFDDTFYFGALTGNQSWRGYASGITFRNLTVGGTGRKEIRLWGWDQGKPVSGVSFENVVIDGTAISDLGDKHFALNDHVRNVRVVPSLSATKDVWNSSLEFSGTQGSNNWRWQSWNGSSLADVAYNSGTGKYGGADYLGHWQANQMHPSASLAAARSWTAPRAGAVQIKGTAAKWDTGGGDGVLIKIVKNGAQIWPASGWATIGAADRLGVQFGPVTTVAAGDVIAVIVDKNATSASDSTIVDENVSYRPEWNAAEDFLPYQSGYDWTYGTFDGTTFTNATWESANGRWKGAGAYNILRDGGYVHPDTTPTARRWTASSAGTIDVTSTIRKLDAGGGDGVRAKIYKNGTQIWPSSGWATMGATDAVGISANVSGVTVVAGDTLTFALDRNANADYDSSYWAPNIRFR